MSWWTLCTSSRLSANQHINSWIYILGWQLFRISLHLWLLGKHDTSTTNKSSFECQWMKQGKKTTRDTRKIASCIWNINHYNYIIKPQKNAKNLRARNPLVDMEKTWKWEEKMKSIRRWEKPLFLVTIRNWSEYDFSIICWSRTI